MAEQTINSVVRRLRRRGFTITDTGPEQAVSPADTAGGQAPAPAPVPAPAVPEMVRPRRGFTVKETGLEDAQPADPAAGQAPDAPPPVWPRRARLGVPEKENTQENAQDRQGEQKFSDKTKRFILALHNNVNGLPPPAPDAELPSDSEAAEMREKAMRQKAMGSVLPAAPREPTAPAQVVAGRESAPVRTPAAPEPGNTASPPGPVDGPAPASSPVRTPVAPEPAQPAPGRSDDGLGDGARSGNPRANDFRRQIAEDLIERIQQGTAPWQKGWDPSIGNHGMPRNAVTGYVYRGMNSFILDMKSPDGDPRWMTYNQAKEKGWQVKKGEKATKVEFWKKVDKDPDREAVGGRDDSGADGVDGKKGRERDSYLVHRTFPVFHASQIDGIPPLEQKPLPPEHERFEKAEQVALAVGAPVIESKSGRAAYSPSLDKIQMPPRAAFKEAGGYESVLLHEAGHATGHESRLNRPMSIGFGSPDYAREELRAEMTSAILSRELGVPHDPDRHAAYAAGWAEAIRKDPNELFKAARDAQKIADYMVDRAREKGVEIDSVLEAPSKAAEPSRQTGQDRSPAPAETPVKVLGSDVRRWTGRVTEISDDKTQVTMRAAGRDTVVRMPDGQTVPDGLAPGAYGKLIAGKDGQAPVFADDEKDKSKSRANQRGRGGQGREIER